jgi:putative membrane protein
MKRFIMYPLLLLIPATAYAQTYPQRMHSWHMIGWGWGLGLGLLGIFFWIMAIIGIICLVGRLMRRTAFPHPYPTHDNALEILKKRYVRGEIAKEEFEQKRKDIEY